MSVLTHAVDPIEQALTSATGGHAGGWPRFAGLCAVSWSDWRSG